MTDQKSPLYLTIYTDGGSMPNPGPAGIGVVIKNGDLTVKTISNYIGNATNNQAEYLALIAGLEEARNLGAKLISIRLDSELIVRQIQGSYRVRDLKLAPLYFRVKQLLQSFDYMDIEHIPRHLNEQADRLVHEARDNHKQGRT
ncbi:MAG: ribonuclease HI family protein [Chloroflexi bacterium]|nr:ribonuclease HI family protein [Chloroflexota bacterium]